MILKNRDHCPPDGFRYVHTESGYESKAIDIYTWFEDIRKHRAANGYPVITVEDAMAQLCETLPPGWCTHSLPEQRSRPWVNTRLRWRDIVEGVKPYLKFLVGSITPASNEEANRRARICAGCYFRVNPQGCGSCVKIARLITGEIAGKKTQHDSHLVNRACAICACPVASLVWFPMPILETPEVDSAEKQAAYPTFCWRKRGAENYQPESI